MPLTIRTIKTYLYTHYPKLKWSLDVFDNCVYNDPVYESVPKIFSIGKEGLFYVRTISQITKEMIR